MCVNSDQTPSLCIPIQITTSIIQTNKPISLISLHHRHLLRNHRYNSPPPLPLPTGNSWRQVQRRRTSILSAEVLHFVLSSVLIQEVARSILSNDSNVRTASRTQIVENTRVNRVRCQLDGFVLFHIGTVAMLQNRHGSIRTRSQCIVRKRINARVKSIREINTFHLARFHINGFLLCHIHPRSARQRYSPGIGTDDPQTAA